MVRKRISRIELTEIVIARYEEILGQVRQELERNGAIHGLYHGVVLTGDASQIEGMVTLTRRMLGVSAHLGNPPVQVTADEQKYCRTTSLSVCHCRRFVDV